MTNAQEQYRRVNSRRCCPDANAEFIEQVATLKLETCLPGGKQTLIWRNASSGAIACGNAYIDDRVMFQFRTPLSGERRGGFPDGSTKVIDWIGFSCRRGPGHVRCATHVRRLHLQQIDVRPRSDCFRSVHGAFRMADRKIRCAVAERRVAVREPRSVPDTGLTCPAHGLKLTRCRRAGLERAGRLRLVHRPLKTADTKPSCKVRYARSTRPLAELLFAAERVDVQLVHRSPEVRHTVPGLARIHVAKHAVLVAVERARFAVALDVRAGSSK